MNKAIDTLESLIEYLENEVRPSCEYYIYSNLIDITDKAIAELKAKDEYIAELEAMVEKMKCCENCKHVVFDYGGTDCLISKTGCKIAFNNLTEDFWKLKDTK